MRGMQARAVEGVRDWNAWIEAEHGADALYLMCSHGDIIKAIVADALGMHLDLFQRITAGPCSATVITYTPLRPFLIRLGDTGELSSLAPSSGSPESPDGERESAGDAGHAPGDPGIATVGGSA